MDVLEMKKILSRLVLAVICVATLFFCVRQAIDPNSYANRLISLKPNNLIAQASSLVLPEPPVVKPKPDPIIIAGEIRRLARLETATVPTDQIITDDRNQDQLWGIRGETITFVAYGQVIAGVDLNKITKNDIVVTDPDTIKIKLPKAEIFSVILTSDSYVASRDKGVLASFDKDMESRVREKAETRCRNAALSQGILDTASTNAEEKLKSFLLDNFLANYGVESILFQ